MAVGICFFCWHTLSPAAPGVPLLPTAPRCPCTTWLNVRWILGPRALRKHNQHQHRWQERIIKIAYEKWSSPASLVAPFLHVDLVCPGCLHFPWALSVQVVQLSPFHPRIVTHLCNARLHMKNLLYVHLLPFKNKHSQMSPFGLLCLQVPLVQLDPKCNPEKKQIHLDWLRTTAK